MEEVCKVTDCSVIVKKESNVLSKIIAMFPDEPRMPDVMWCESEHRQFDEFGKPLISETSDVGVGQINQVHWKEAKKLGLDIFYDVDDNLVMSRRIYDSQGIKAWNAIKSDCYRKLSSLSG